MNNEKMNQINENKSLENDEYIQEGLLNKTIKKCVHCDAFGELASGCNYIKCPICKGEWCWVCELPKYKEARNKPACNDKSHNSH